MKNYYLLSLFFISLFDPVYSQINFQTHEIPMPGNSNGIHSSDIDGDGDNDIIGISFNGSGLIWYENIDGQGNFINHTITNLPHCTGLYTADIDGDDDMDVISSQGVSGPTDSTYWHENTDGLGNFIDHQLSYFGEDSVHSGDIDGDGDMDIISGSRWHENIDGQGNFNEPVLLTNFNWGYVQLVDIDNDVDLEIVGTLIWNGEFGTYWAEYIDELGHYGTPQLINDTGSDIRDIYSVDINGDGYMDILEAQSDGNNLWNENLSLLEVVSNQQKSIKLSPNPSKNIIKIQSEQFIKNIKVYDVLGKLLIEQNQPSKQLDISNLSSGLLFIQIETDEGVLVKKVIKE